MQAKKRLFALLFCALLLLTFALPAAAEDIPLSRVTATPSRPLIGQPSGTLYFTSAEPEKYTATVSEIYYLVSVPGVGVEERYLAPSQTFEAQIQYFCRVRFTAKDGYSMHAGQTTCVIPGRSDVRETGYSASTKSLTFEYAFFAEETANAAPEVPMNGCPYCGRVHSGLFGIIVQALHNLFYYIVGPKK